MNDTLFDTPDPKYPRLQKSPRLKWLETHCVKTEHTNFTEGDKDEFGNDLWPWFAFIGATRFADANPKKRDGGATENEAIAKLAIGQGWQLWNEEKL